MIKDYNPKVGDVVRITKSESNWIHNMDKYDGLRLIISKVSIVKGMRHVSFENSDKYPGITQWCWVYEDGHFTPVKVTEKKLLKFRLWNPINQKSETQ